MTTAGRGRAVLLVVVIAVVTVTVTIALRTLDTPWTARQRRLDDARIRDLRAIARAIDLHWTRHDELPTSLDELDGVRRLADPVSEQPYVFRPTAQDAYELCASFTFAWPAADQRLQSRVRRVSVGDAWSHPAGEHCFTLEAEKVSR